MEEEEESVKRVGKPINVEVYEKREDFYKKHIDNIVVDGAMAPMKNAVFEELARITN